MHGSVLSESEFHSYSYNYIVVHSGAIDNTVVVSIPVYHGVVCIALVWFAVRVVLQHGIAWYCSMEDMGDQHLVQSPYADDPSRSTFILLVINIIKKKSKLLLLYHHHHHHH